MGKSSGSTTVKQTNDPWKGVQPYLKDYFSQVQGIVNQGAYGGPFLGQQSPYSQQYIQQLAGMGNDPNSLIGQAQGELGRTLSGQYLTVDGNPAAQAAMNAAQRAVSKQFSGDNYGGSANREWLGRGVAEAVSPMLMQERQNQLNAVSAAPGLQTAQAALLGQAGAMQDARSQAEVDAERAKFQSPQDLMAFYGGSLQPGLGFRSGSTTQPSYTNPVASALGMGIGGLSLYNGLGAAGLLGGGTGLGIGAAALGGGGGPLAGLASSLGPFALAL